MLGVMRLLLSYLILFLVLLSFGILSFNVLLLHKYRRRSFFTKRSIHLLVLTIIPSAIEVFILIPTTTATILSDTNNSFDFRLWIFLHTTCINIWICTIYTRLWYVFVQVRKQQDSLKWKKVFNPDYTTWVSKHYHTIGNPRYISFLLLLVCVIISSLSACILYALNLNSAAVFESLRSLGLDPVLFVFFVFELVWITLLGVSFAWCVIKIVQFNDFWKLKHEFKRYIYSFPSYWISVTAALVTFASLDTGSDRSSGGKFVFLCVLLVTTLQMIFCWNASLSYVVYLHLDGPRRRRQTNSMTDLTDDMRDVRHSRGRGRSRRRSHSSSRGHKSSKSPKTSKNSQTSSNTQNTQDSSQNTPGHKHSQKSSSGVSGVSSGISGTSGTSGISGASRASATASAGFGAVGPKGAKMTKKMSLVSVQSVPTATATSVTLGTDGSVSPQLTPNLIEPYVSPTLAAMPELESRVQSASSVLGPTGYIVTSPVAGSAGSAASHVSGVSPVSPSSEVSHNTSGAPNEPKKGVQSMKNTENIASTKILRNDKNAKNSNNTNNVIFRLLHRLPGISSKRAQNGLQRVESPTASHVSQISQKTSKHEKSSNKSKNIESNGSNGVTPSLSILTLPTCSSGGNALFSSSRPVTPTIPESSDMPPESLNIGAVSHPKHSKNKSNAKGGNKSSGISKASKASKTSKTASLATPQHSKKRTKRRLFPLLLSLDAVSVSVKTRDNSFQDDLKVEYSHTHTHTNPSLDTGTLQHPRGHDGHQSLSYKFDTMHYGYHDTTDTGPDTAAEGNEHDIEDSHSFHSASHSHTRSQTPQHVPNPNNMQNVQHTEQQSTQLQIVQNVQNAQDAQDTQDTQDAVQVPVTPLMPATPQETPQMTPQMTPQISPDPTPMPPTPSSSRSPALGAAGTHPIVRPGRASTTGTVVTDVEHIALRVREWDGVMIYEDLETATSQGVPLETIESSELQSDTVAKYGPQSVKNAINAAQAMNAMNAQDPGMAKTRTHELPPVAEITETTETAQVSQIEHVATDTIEIVDDGTNLDKIGKYAVSDWEASKLATGTKSKGQVKFADQKEPSSRKTTIASKMKKRSIQGSGSITGNIAAGPRDSTTATTGSERASRGTDSKEASAGKSGKKKKRRRRHRKRSKSAERRVGVLTVFQSFKLFEKFMEHLTKEFATEVLLFSTILVQFQKFLIKYDYLSHGNGMEEQKHDDTTDTRDSIDIRSLFVPLHLHLTRKIPKFYKIEAMDSWLQDQLNKQKHYQRREWSRGLSARMAALSHKSHSSRNGGDAKESGDEAHSKKATISARRSTLSDSESQRHQRERMERTQGSHPSVTQINFDSAVTGAEDEVDQVRGDGADAMETGDAKNAKDDGTDGMRQVKLLAFYAIYESIFQTFVERRKALLEINLPDGLRTSLTEHEKEIKKVDAALRKKNGDTLDMMPDYHVMWVDLVKAGREMLSLLRVSFNRFEYEYETQQQQQQA